VIRYALVCDQGHEFESWFRNSAAHDEQVARGLVACPLCGSAKVQKALMAPALAKSEKRAPPPPTPQGEKPDEKQGERPDKAPVVMVSDEERELRAKLRELRAHLLKNADYVGERFPDEARRMHYGEIEHRSIYGEASPDDAEALIDEGIEFHPLPRLPDDRN
jgi:hypothetical protein